MSVLRPILERIPPESPVSPVLWFAVLGAPGAYVLQLGVGYWLAEAQCSPTGEQWGIPLDVWGIVVGAVSLAIAIGAAVTSVVLFRRTQEAGDAPPPGRINFLAVVGMTVSTLFIALIVMSTVGIVAFRVCNQS